MQHLGLRPTGQVVGAPCLRQHMPAVPARSNACHRRAGSCRCPLPRSTSRRAATPPEQQQQRVQDGSPEDAAMDILQAFSSRDLEALVPHMAEMSVIKAVVRQHHAKLAEQKRKEARRLQQQQRQQAARDELQHWQQHQRLQQQQQHAAGPPRSLSVYDSSTLASGYSPHHDDTIEPYEASPSSSSSSGFSVPFWPGAAAAAASSGPQQQQRYGGSSSSSSSMPPQPACPVPGTPDPAAAVDDGMAMMGGDTDYEDEYEAYNYAHRWGVPPPPPGTHFGGSSSSSTTLTPGAPDFLAVLDAVQAGDAGRQLLDSFAMRHLVLSRPAQLEPLSCMRLAPDRFVMRCCSTSLWGEKCVLTFSLKQRSEQELRSAYSKQPNKHPWVLSRVEGEPLSSDPLEAISPEHPPEAVVAAQVQALKDCDFDVAYALTSPVGRAVAGTRERFRAALQGDLRYAPLLAHQCATVIHRTHSNANTYLAVLDVTGQPGAGSSLFIWVATRQLEGLYRNCWLVEYVTPVKDPAVIKALL